MARRGDTSLSTPGVAQHADTPAGGGDRRRPRCRGAGHDRRLRLLASRGPTDHARPERRQHGRVRVRRRRTPRASSTIVSNWVPLQSPAGGPYFGKLDPTARYYVKIDNTGDGVEDVAYRWQFKNKFRNPNSFLYAVPPVNSINDPNLNFVQTYDLYYETSTATGRLDDYRADRATTCRSRPTTSGRRRCRTTRRSPTARSATRAAAARRSSARPTTRSSSTSARSSTASTSTSPAARRSGSATRAAARTTSRATTPMRSSLQVPTSEVTRDGRPVDEREGPQRGRRRVVDHRAPQDQGQRARQGRGRAGSRSAASATR